MVESTGTRTSYDKCVADNGAAFTAVGAGAGLLAGYAGVLALNVLAPPTTAADNLIAVPVVSATTTVGGLAGYKAAEAYCSVRGR